MALKFDFRLFGKLTVIKLSFECTCVCVCCLKIINCQRFGIRAKLLPTECFNFTVLWWKHWHMCFIQEIHSFHDAFFYSCLETPFLVNICNILMHYISNISIYVQAASFSEFALLFIKYFNWGRLFFVPHVGKICVLYWMISLQHLKYVVIHEMVIIFVLSEKFVETKLKHD